MVSYYPDKIRTYTMQRLSQSLADHRYYLREIGEIPKQEVYSVEEAIAMAGL